jgi:hypothetical protein
VLLRKAKMAEELRTAQAMLLPLECGLSLEIDGKSYRALDRNDLPFAHALLQGSPSRCNSWAEKSGVCTSTERDKRDIARKAGKKIYRNVWSGFISGEAQFGECRYVGALA